MAGTRKLSPERKAFINGLIEHYHPEDAQDVQEMLKDLLVIILVRQSRQSGVARATCPG